MYTAIKELLNEILDKMQYLFTVVTLFCLFITFFSIPESIRNNSLIQLIFPDVLVDQTNLELSIYLMSFYGFVWIVFFIMAVIADYLPRMFLNSFFELKRILEVTGRFLMIILEYVYIYIKFRIIDAELIDEAIRAVDHPLLLSVGIGVPIILLLFTIMNMIYEQS